MWIDGEEAPQQHTRCPLGKGAFISADAPPLFVFSMHDACQPAVVLGVLP